MPATKSNYRLQISSSPYNAPLLKTIRYMTLHSLFTADLGNGQFLAGLPEQWVTASHHFVPAPYTTDFGSMTTVLHHPALYQHAMVPNVPVRVSQVFFGLSALVRLSSQFILSLNCCFCIRELAFISFPLKTVSRLSKLLYVCWLLNIFDILLSPIAWLLIT